MRRFFGTAVLLGTCSAWAIGECASLQTQTVRSPNGKHTLTLHHDGRFKLDGVRGQVRLNGHHWKAYLSNDGRRFLVADSYDGLTVVDGLGRVVERFDGDALCWKRTDAWACHPEGTWSRQSTRVGTDQVRLDVGFGPDLTVDFSTSKVRLVTNTDLEGALKVGGFVGFSAMGAALFVRQRRRFA